MPPPNLRLGTITKSPLTLFTQKQSLQVQLRWSWWHILSPPSIATSITTTRLIQQSTMSAAVIALATILAIVLVVASVLITLLYVQLRRRRSYNGAVESTPLTPGFGIFNFIPPWDPAAQITPFGSSPQVPVFKFEPGTNMRIAHRNSQGGWEFHETGLPENDKLPRPQSVRSSIFTRTTRSHMSPSSPGSISSSHWTAGPTTSSSREFVSPDFPPTAPPPPAYCKDDKR